MVTSFYKTLDKIKEGPGGHFSSHRQNKRGPTKTGRPSSSKPATYAVPVASSAGNSSAIR